ncbi:type II toxin-antitoxin system RelE/ParE family toxin [Collimonas sp.]|jgi:putative addiction module killer protein|uniref:type II toxin-antitoxin system RelE/ParE family toxin n=1 Tax=Collimonas sp. TaxID=1963772 RepID=UPI002B6C9977|nr:type II toxin-antitoxin system RelE/ParE family toxin [Collimonas sp.]HWW03869.1 type II toxin-antitoxin system RelE/ParE family toxin [Collimonas sp.]
MLDVLLSDVFKDWLLDLRDVQGKAKILTRIRSASYGNLGDVEAVGEGVSELRIHCGPGYRIYFTRRGKALILLLVGGDKSSQKKDIKLARQMAKSLKE